MKKALIAKKEKRSAGSGAWEWICSGVSAFFAMSFQLPPCLSRLELGGWGRFPETILTFYKRLWFMAKMALESTGSTVISFSPEEEAKILGVSPNTIRHWNAYFGLNGILDPQDQKGGRGKKATFRFHFTPPPQVIHSKTPQQVVPFPFLTTTLRTPPPTASSRQPETTHAAKKTTETPLKNRPEDTQIPPPKSSAAQQRAEKLRKLPDETLLRGKFSNWVMEQFRHRCMDMGFTREESDILCNTIGRLIKGKTLGYARRVAKWFWQQTRTVLRKLREAAKNGLRAAYAMLGYLFRKALGLLKPKPTQRKKQPSTAKKPWRWDLNDPEERKAFLDRVENIIKEGGGTCPRCGNVLRVDYWTVSSALAFQDPDGCRCLYIALDRDMREREKRHQLEKETRTAQQRTTTKPRGLVKTLGDVLCDLLGGGKEPRPDPEGERLLALQDPEEIRRILVEALDRPWVSHKSTSTTIRAP